MRDRRADLIAGSLQYYISNLDQSFEEDFAPYLPNLNYFNFLKGKRQEFEDEIKQSFKLYINDKIAAWSRTAENEFKEAFGQLALSASQYGSTYSQITDQITTKFTGHEPRFNGNVKSGNDPSWAKWAAERNCFFNG